jgi:hypothetical protein
MKSDLWKRIVKNGSLFMVFCFSLTFFYGVTAQASTLSSQTNVLLSDTYSNNKDSGNFAIGFGNDGIHNYIMPYSSSDTVDISARVYVRAYHRKDGTYVRSHYRRDPR